MTIRPITYDELFNELTSTSLQPQLLQKGLAPSQAYTGVATDSRRCHAHEIFCAIVGHRYDPHVDVGSGSLSLSPLVLVEQDVTSPLKHQTVVRVSSTRAAWAVVSALLAGSPQKKLRFFGITGTNGKTSTVWLLKNILEAHGHRVLSIGTLGFMQGDQLTPSSHTTPDPDVLYPALAKALDSGVSHVVMEVSSHALVQGKLTPIKFEGAGFTSFSQDHLDFHRTMDEYLSAKLSFFTKLVRKDGLISLHEQVAALPAVKAATKDFSYMYVYGQHARFTLHAEQNLLRGQTNLTLTDQSIGIQAHATIAMVGHVFSENFACAALLATKALELNLADLAPSLRRMSIPPVPGRLERVQVGKPWRPSVFIDYAHTPDALEKAITSLSLTPKSVTTVFGCGGERDKDKRPLMGKIAADLSALVYVTSDNPRSEDAAAIIQDICAGIDEGASHITVEPDRGRAIQWVCEELGGRDIVLIAGKGHEAYQQIGHEKIPFSDQAHASAALAKDRSWLVVGAGVSGQAAAQLLARSGEKVFLTDDKAPPMEKIAAWKEQHIHFCSVAEALELENIDSVVCSPGIDPGHPVLATFRQRRTPLISEIDLGFDQYPGRILAVTGTNGKSTTVMMAEHALKQLGIDASACGNIGRPPSDLDLRRMSSDHCAVAELSSYQLEISFPLAAHVAAFTSFSFDHLTRHKTLKDYFLAKWRITLGLKSSSRFIVTEEVASYAFQFGAPWPACEIYVLSQGHHEFPKDERFKIFEWRDESVYQGQTCVLDASVWKNLPFTGHHNQINAVTAALLVQPVVRASLQEVFRHLSGFKSLPYRCEVVWRSGNQIFINDSKSTNLESTVAALTMVPNLCVLLMGGQGKGESYENLENYASKIFRLVTFGASHAEIARDCSDRLRVDQFKTMSEAVLHAASLARQNRIDLLFSPGCASFDEFKNFEHRGQVFNELIRSVTES